MKNSTLLFTAKRMLFVLFIIITGTKLFGQQIILTPKTFLSGANISCHGTANGFIDATIVGGTTPYTYHWSNGATTEDLANITAGSYTLTVTDAASHTVSKEITLNEPAALTVNLNPSLYQGGYNISGNGKHDGELKTDVHGGSSPYSYTWSNSTSTESGLFSITAGTYSVTITDANGCSLSSSYTLTEPNALSILSITAANHNGHNISCFGGSDGSITLAVNGGVAPYKYSWSNGNFEQNPTDLNAGDYTVIVKDANNTEVQGQITLTEPTKLNVKLTASNYNGYSISCNNCFNGTITANVTGGTSAFTYLWDGGQTTANLQNLGVGTYTVTVTDANGCQASNEEGMTEPANVGWERTGNSNLDSTVDFIGSTNHAPIVIKTDNMERMRITANGDALFQKSLQFGGGGSFAYLPPNSGGPDRFVLGNSVRSSSFTDPCINPLTGGRPSVDFAGLFRSGGQPYGPTNGQQIDIMTMGCDGYNGVIDVTGDHTINGGTGPDLQLNTNCGHNVVICDGLSGKVGVGNFHPVAKLDVQNSPNDVAVQPTFRLSNLTYRILMEPKLTAHYYNNITQDNDAGIFWTDASNGGGGNNQSAGLVFAPVGSGQYGAGIRITNEGKVGIGTALTSNPNGYTLAVNGIIGAKELKIEITSTTWSDFVFDKNYKRMSFLEKEAYYKKEKHLPNIVSAKEIGEKGLTVSAVMAGMTQNIEENTIDIVELYKRMIEIEKENAELKKKIEKLEKNK